MNLWLKLIVTLASCAVVGAVFGLATSSLLGSNNGMLGLLITGGVGVGVAREIWQRLPPSPPPPAP